MIIVKRCGGPLCLHDCEPMAERPRGCTLVPETREEAHTCHAEGCRRRVPPRLLMCKKHWLMVPPKLRQDVWGTYVSGQEDRMDPSREYLDAAMAAINAVKEKENG